MNKVNIYRGWCKKCGICTAFCPQGIIKENRDNYPVITDMEKCTGCRLCEIRCPDFAIVVESDTGAGKDKAGDAKANPTTG